MEEWKQNCKDVGIKLSKLKKCPTCGVRGINTEYCSHLDRTGHLSKSCYACDWSSDCPK